MNSRIARKVFRKGPSHPRYRQANKALTRLGGPYLITINLQAAVEYIKKNFRGVDA